MVFQAYHFILHFCTAVLTQPYPPYQCMRTSDIQRIATAKSLLPNFNGVLSLLLLEDEQQ